jgi:hypothetical protein
VAASAAWRVGQWCEHLVVGAGEVGSGQLLLQVWSGDGRLTAGHLAVLHRWIAGGVLITLMDGTPVVHLRPGESEEEMGRRL